MGTRGAFGFRIDGKDKIAYNHMDSYPEGLGQTVVEFLKGFQHEVTLESLRKAVREIEVIDTDVSPTAAQKERFKPIANLNVGERTLDDWYCLMRELQGDPARCVEYRAMPDDSAFLASMSCEWAYIVNLDDLTFEVYTGYQRKPHNRGRYAGLPPDKIPGGPTYYPVALVATYPIRAIPADWVKQVEKEDEDEEAAPAPAPAPTRRYFAIDEAQIVALRSVADRLQEEARLAHDDRMGGPAINDLALQISAVLDNVNNIPID